MVWRVICDRCGFEITSNEARHEWTGLIVCGECWEPRHEQDYVKGVRDHQNVPFARPDPPDSFGAPFTAKLTAAGAAGATSLTVDATTNFTAGNYAHVSLDDGQVFRTTIASVGGATALTIDDALPSGAAIGANVIDLGISP